MIVDVSPRSAFLAKAGEFGMGRFFSPTNLRRYRSLVDDAVDAPERGRVLKALAEEWGAFTRECRIPSGTHLLPCRDVVFEVET